MRRTAIASLAIVLSMLAVVPAQATTVSVTVVDYAFSPKGVKAPMGATVQWTNTGVHTHTSTQDAPLGLWSLSLSPGTSQSTMLTAAGAYPYHCAIHAVMVGKVKVPGAVSPSSGTTSTIFTITLASVPAASGFSYGVQMRVGSGSWTSYATGVTTTTTTFHPSAPGTYSFRSRLFRISTGGASGWSPARTVTVS